LKVYAYKNCDTCRKAKKFLKAEGIDYELIPIREQPPTKSELKTMLACYKGNIRKLFNTSGGDYKSMNMKEKLPGMSNSEAIDLLSKNGNLIKRPFALLGKIGTVGFNKTIWEDLFI
tara:strand:- start:4499 stop:4849 length:351 start_codon:yes stop_codon:yes gene_type:complete